MGAAMTFTEAEALAILCAAASGVNLFRATQNTLELHPDLIGIAYRRSVGRMLDMLRRDGFEITRKELP